MIKTDSSWSPNQKTAFLSFLTVGLLSATFNVNVISDCDEVMNYWEPTHYLTYGKGFQTWEYSPAYGLRSYAYILIHATVAKLLSQFTTDKILVFHGVRIFLSLIATVTQTFFYSSIQARFGNRPAFFTFLFLLFSPGMFIASTAYLPSSFSMYGLLVAFGAWFTQRYMLAVTSVAFSVLLGWPFCIVVAIPLALDSIYQRGFPRIFLYGLASLLYFLVPCIVIDYFYYRKVFVAIWNIIVYNALSNHGGPNLYGTEPWNFYFINGFLNWNIVFPVTLLGIILNVREIKYTVSFYMWFAWMTSMAHKEERFLFVVYPLIAFLAGMGMSKLEEIALWVLRKVSPRSVKVVTLNKVISLGVWIYCILFIVLSVSRIVSLKINYGAPLRVYQFLSEKELSKEFSGVSQVNVCVGKEWYRFPSNFFLPSNRFDLQFVQSGFTGQLPKPYGNGTWIIPSDFNDLNKQEMSRYVDVSKCHYFVDLDFEEQAEPHYAKMSDDWEIIYQAPFLDAAKSTNTLYRAFYVPFLSEKYNKFNTYYVLRSTKLIK